MSSLITNTSSMVALQTLRGINSQLDQTNNRVSTGLRVNSASDNAAYWSLATTTRSDNGALGAVKDALGLGKASVDVANTGLDNVRDALQKIKEKLVTAAAPDTDRAKLQTEITSLINQMKNTADSSVISGGNWLSVDSGGAGFNASKEIVASFSRTGTTVTVDTISVDISKVKLYDAADQSGIIDKDRTSGGSTIAVSGIDISALTGSAADLTTISEYTAIVDEALLDLTDASTQLGAVTSRIGSQESFVKALIDANDRAIGALVDADMEEESTRLKALQTQQQLAIQSLGIANSSSQNILSLFRN
ncbi:flagellin N-terminal helical domain-containing protein [Afifella pfennigii]|uniref:flagellin N-terminal helical domain-containing protein n=1 Tax=Afifella pfennigii TaxID=209897 RepID=UPI00047DD339|nr:flagellin [Afifella pfennigii]